MSSPTLALDRLRAPGFFRAAWIVCAKDLKIEWRTLETLTTMVLFTLVVLVVFSFAFGLATTQQVGVDKLIPGVIWTAFSFSAIVGFARSFNAERRNDTWTALQQSPVDRGSLFIGKALANLVKVVVLEALALPLSALFFDFNLFEVLPFLIGIVILHTIGLVELGTLVSAVAAKLGRGETLVSILLFPFSAPLFISAVKCTGAALAGRDIGTVSVWLGLTIGFDVLFLLVALLTFDYVLEE